MTEEAAEVNRLCGRLKSEMPSDQQPYDATYVSGIGWMAVTPLGRYGSYETKDGARRAARDLYLKMERVVK